MRQAGIIISGINAEVMPGQWEFQIGPVGALEVGDQVHLARYLLHLLGEKYGIVSTLNPTPAMGYWMGGPPPPPLPTHPPTHPHNSARLLRKKFGSSEFTVSEIHPRSLIPVRSSYISINSASLVTSVHSSFRNVTTFHLKTVKGDQWASPLTF
jgi:hypothetical protein